MSGGKAQRIEELRANGKLPKHIEQMIEDGMPLDLIALPGEERPKAPATTAKPASEHSSGKAAKPSQEAKPATTPVPAVAKKSDPPPKPATGGKPRKDEVMRTTATKTKPAAKRAAPKAKTTERRKAKSDNARKPVEKAPRGNVVEILKLASRPNGVSRAELIALTKWEGAPWKWLFKNSKGTGYCDRWGYSLQVIEGKEGETRYHVKKK